MDRDYARVMCIVSPFYSNLIVVFVSEALQIASRIWVMQYFYCSFHFLIYIYLCSFWI